MLHYKSATQGLIVVIKHQEVAVKDCKQALAPAALLSYIPNAIAIA